MDKLIFFVLALYALATRGRSSRQPSAAELEAEAERARREAERARQAEIEMTSAQEKPKPWPTAAPSGLPPFPSGWQYAEPPSAAVRARAWQLLDELWKQGSGATRVELTEGTWITYRSEITKGGKRGVVAYRVKTAAQRAKQQPSKVTIPPQVIRSPGVPQGVKTSTPAPAPRMTETGKPWLHQGAGMGSLKPLAPHVLHAQRRLQALGHYTGNIDGMFGPKMKAAVLAFQKARGLKQDGIIGDNTWPALDATGAVALAS